MLDGAASPSSGGPQPRLRLRRPLNVSLRESAGTPFYLIEDPIRQQFFRLGVPEWEFASRLDGSLTMAEALQAVYGDDSDSEDVSPQFADRLCRWLISNQLIDAASLPEGMRPNQGAAAAPPFNPFFIKVPLLHPDRFVGSLLRWLAPLLSVQAFVMWLGLIGYGGYCIAANWDAFTSSASAYFSPTTWIWLFVVWLVLKVLHETFHGLVCKKYGGDLGAAGLLLILLSPVAFVDVTSSWRFRSRWHRIFTSGAGMYVEFAVASVAAIVWAHTQDGMLNFVMHSVVTTASITTLLFNANPLMRFDGYYILADLFDFQNLYSVAKGYTKGRIKQFFLGEAAPEIPETGLRLFVIGMYGILSTIWSLLISVSMVLGAAVLFHGAGVALAAFGAFCWFAMPVYKFGSYIVLGNKEGPSPPRRRFATSTLAVVLTVLAILILPWPGGVCAPAIVQYENKTSLRAAADGFVSQVAVRPGQAVEAGDVLLVMTNPEMEKELEQVRCELRASEIECRKLRTLGEIAGSQAEQENLNALTDKEAGLRDRVESLEVVAREPGVVLSSRLDDILGQFMEAGSVLLEIGNESDKVIELAIAEEYVDTFSRKVGMRPRVSVAGRTLSAEICELTQVEPSASLHLRHQALGGNNGGPLPVQPVAAGESENSVELVAPHTHATVSIDQETARQLRGGQLAKVRFWDPQESVGRRLYRSAIQWVRSKLAIAKQA